MKNSKKSTRGNVRGLIKSWAVPIGCGLLFLFLLQFVFFMGYVPSDSMEPTIKESSVILGIRVFSNLARGDIIIFTRGNSLLVKRITGVPGDTVYANGETLVVPDSCYFVLGDNPDHSIDSRFWNEPFISMGNIIAKVCI